MIKDGDFSQSLVPFDEGQYVILIPENYLLNSNWKYEIATNGTSISDLLSVIQKQI